LFLFTHTQCEHSKLILPEWKRLGEDISSSKTVVIGQIDCTTRNERKLCDEHRIWNFPTVRYGSPSSESRTISNDLSTYEGGRTYRDLSKFMENYLSQPQCSPTAIDSCTDSNVRQKLQTWTNLSTTEIEDLIREQTNKLRQSKNLMEQAAKDFEKRYDELVAVRDSKIQEVRDSGLTSAQSILNFRMESRHATTTIKDEL
jgi:arsenate reductase-like glutaredoxin family protein